MINNYPIITLCGSTRFKDESSIMSSYVKNDDILKDMCEDY